ncbi:MAG TPA: ABC transporter permease [Pyrinomonadaceae bacterium]|nr:ABC transporter permease [Pyrinomonadaceae bacterium]
MPYEFFLAFRHLRSRRNRRLARVTALIALTGISVGVAALIVAQALANGFRDEMRDKILRGTSHLTVMRSDGQSIANYKDLAARISRIEGVTSAAGTTYDGAVIVGPSDSSYAILRGIDIESGQLSSVQSTVVAGSADPLLNQTSEQKRIEVLIGAELARRARLEVGHEADIMAVSSGSSSQQRVKIAGIVRTGLFEYDSTWVYLPLKAAEAFAAGRHTVSVISVQVKDIYEVKNLSAKIREVLGSDYTLVDWQEANRPLFTALELERRVGLVIIALIILIAALNITTTLILVVMERRRDIAILNAMGATRSSIMGIFVIEGAVVGLAGAVAGVLLGAIATYLANRFNLISLPPDVYSIAHVTLNLKTVDVFVAALAAFVLSTLATIYPARAAAKVRPAELMRDA